MKALWILGFAMGMTVGCNETPPPWATGGSGGAGGSTGGMGGEGGGTECTTDDECPVSPILCHTTECMEGACLSTTDPDGTPCLSLAQDGAGTCVGGECMADECTTPNDCEWGDECALTYCTNGACQYVQDTAKTVCDGGAGQCVVGSCQTNGCVGAADGVACPMCDLEGVCKSGMCYPLEIGPPHCD